MRQVETLSNLQEMMDKGYVSRLVVCLQHIAHMAAKCYSPSLPQGRGVSGLSRHAAWEARCTRTA